MNPSLYATYSRPATSLPAESTTSVTTHWVRTSTVEGRRASDFSALYFACSGQIGMQLELPSQRMPVCGAPTAPTG